MRRKSVEEEARIPNAFGIVKDETDLQPIRDRSQLEA